MKLLCFILLLPFLSTSGCQYEVSKRESFKTRTEGSRLVTRVNKAAVDKMVEVVPGEMDKIRSSYHTAVQSCNNKIEGAEKRCKQCMKDQQKLHINPCIFFLTTIKKIVDVLKMILIQPYVEAGKVVKEVMGKFGKAVTKLGKVGIKFLKDLGKFTEKLGKDLTEGAGKLVKNSVEGLKQVGKNLVNLSEKVGKEIGKGLHGLGKGVENTLHGLGRETDKLLKGIGDVTNQVGKGLEHTAKEIVKAPVKIINIVSKPIHNVVRGISRSLRRWFGKKRDIERSKRVCSANCDICDKMDDKVYSQEQIIDNICGPQINALEKRTLRLQQNILTLVKFLMTSLEGGPSVIKSIRYDRDSEVEEDSYSTNYIKYEINNKHHEFQSTTPLDTYYLTDTGRSIGKQIMGILKGNEYKQV